MMPPAAPPTADAATTVSTFAFCCQSQEGAAAAAGEAGVLAAAPAAPAAPSPAELGSLVLALGPRLRDGRLTLGRAGRASAGKLGAKAARSRVGRLAFTQGTQSGSQALALALLPGAAAAWLAAPPPSALPSSACPAPGPCASQSLSLSLSLPSSGAWRSVGPTLGWGPLRMSSRSSSTRGAEPTSQPAGSECCMGRRRRSMSRGPTPPFPGACATSR